MHLALDEVKRFYEIWFPLLHYINQNLHIVPSFPQTWSSVPAEAAFALRQALWQNDALREAFITENPVGLSAADLALVESCKDRIEGEFFVFRYLKKYAIFIDTETPAHAYGVLGLVISIEEIVGPYVPIYVKAVLLPFEDRIIYDSMLIPYNVHFGAGYRRGLAETYRAVQERNGIITTLRPADKSDTPKTAQAGNKKVLTAFQKAQAQSGLSPKMIEEHTQTVTDFADSFLVKQEPPVMLLDMTRQHIEQYQSSYDGPINLVSFKRFVWFLRDTGRMDWDRIEDLLGYLKSQKS